MGALQPYLPKTTIFNKFNSVNSRQRAVLTAAALRVRP
jgi:hypothetical protein